MSYAMCALYTYFEAFVFTNKRKTFLARQKGKHIHKTLREKAQTLKEILRRDYLTKRLQQNIMYQKIPYLHRSKIKAKSYHY